MRLYPLLALAIIGAAVVLGAPIVLDHFNRALLPPEPVQAVSVERLDNELVRCDILGAGLVLSVPDPSDGLWTELDGR